MHAQEQVFLEFQRAAFQLVLPLFQRRYRWDLSDAEKWYRDILRAGRSSDATYYVGAIVYIAPDLSRAGARAPFSIVDGQQRVMTLIILLEALARFLEASGMPPPDGFAPAQIRAYYLRNEYEIDPLRRQKLVPTEHDHDVISALLRQIPPPHQSPDRIAVNFAYFERQIKALDPDGIAALCRGLEKLVIVTIRLVQGVDNAPQFFESINATGRDLADADLIRNQLFMDLDPAMQFELYRTYMRPLEKTMGDAWELRYPDLLRAFLALRTGEPRRKRFHPLFKQYATSRVVKQAGRAALLADLLTQARYYHATALGGETDPLLRAAFSRLCTLRARSADPLLLTLYGMHSDGRLAAHDFVQLLHLIEAYLVRRALCGLSAKPHIHVFTRLARAGCQDADTLKATFLLLPQAHRFPGDAEFRSALATQDLYSRSCARHVLESLENHDRREPVLFGRDFTIEHILPQNPDLSPEWRAELGHDAHHVHQTMVHTLGNLTLSSCNRALDDNPFQKKRDMSGGYADSLLRLNADLHNAERWNREAIEQRGERLAHQALLIWPYPVLSAATLEAVRARHEQPGSLSAFPQILSGTPMHEPFEVLRKELLRLHPRMREVPRQHYVAYKVDGNVIDLVPTYQKLYCYINLRPSRVSKSDGIAVDVSGREHWGNGDLLVELRDETLIPYVVELVRRALADQLQSGLPEEPDERPHADEEEKV